MKGMGKGVGLSRILAPVADDLALAGRQLNAHVDAICEGQTLSASYQTHVTRMLKHFFKVPGKMLRPALVLLSGKVVSPDDERNADALVKMAVAVELLHSASLIHDDIIDEAGDRRNRVSLNRLSGNHLAVLIGDILYSQFFSTLTELEYINSDQKLEIFRVFSALTKKMCLGEIYQEKIRQDGFEPNVDDYVKIIDHKSASLMSTCCYAGAYVEGADDKILGILADFGLNFGLAFQIMDDCLDEDAVFHDKAELTRIAAGYIENAKAEINKLDGSAIIDSFRLMTDYIASKIN